MSGQVERIASLLRERNALDEQIGAIIQRPMTHGHLGEWIAAQIFGIELEPSAVQAGIDGRFTAGPLEGRSVNVKWYLRPALGGAVVARWSSPVADRGCLFVRRAAVAGRATGPRRQDRDSVERFELISWDAAKIYPRAVNPALSVSSEQATLLRLFE